MKKNKLSDEHQELVNGLKSNLPDERQELINQRAFANVGIFLFAAVLFMMIYKLCTTDSMPWEFWAVIGSALIILITNKVMGNVEEPKTFLGFDLPLGNSKQDKNKRRKAYFTEALVYAFGMTVIDILVFVFAGEDTLDFDFISQLLDSMGKTGVIVISAVFSFVLTLVIAYIIEAICGRYKVHQYKKMIAEFDSDEE